MSKGGLSNPLFQPDNRDELELEPYNPEILTENVVGQAMEFRTKDNTPFRIFGLPKNMLLEFRLLSKPCSVIRDVTLSAIDTLDAASVKSSHETRIVLTGEKGTGKSFTLLQAVQYCISRNWIVMYIPRAVTLVNSSTPHIYDPRTRTYLQPAMAYQTLQRFLTVNRTNLSRLTMRNELILDRKPTLPAGTFLKDLIDVGLKDQSVAPTILSVLLSELGEQTAHPVLLAVDDFHALYCQSTYRDPQYQPIKSYHLSMPRLLLEYASGKRSFTRGAVFGAISTTHNSFPIPLELRETLNLSHPIPNSPYFKRSAVMQAYAKGLQKLEVPPHMSVTEAAGMFEIWMKDRALHSAPNDELFMAKYTEASGNPRDFVWRGLLGTLET
jgi:small subunit ribosomal protein S29